MKHVKKIKVGMAQTIMCCMLCFFCTIAIKAAAVRNDIPEDYGQVLISARQNDGNFEGWTKTFDGMYLSPELSLGQVENPVLIMWHYHSRLEPRKIQKVLVSEDGINFAEYTPAENGLNRIPNTAVRLKVELPEYVDNDIRPTYFTLGEMFVNNPHEDLSDTVSMTLVRGDELQDEHTYKAIVGDDPQKLKLELTAKIGPASYEGDSEDVPLSNAAILLDVPVYAKIVYPSFSINQEYSELEPGNITLTFTSGTTVIQSSTLSYYKDLYRYRYVLAFVPKNATDVNLKIEWINNYNPSGDEYLEVVVPNPQALVYEMHCHEEVQDNTIEGLDLSTKQDMWHDIDGDGIKEWVCSGRVNKFRADLKSQILLEGKGADINGWICYDRGERLDAYSSNAIYRVDGASFEEVLSADVGISLRPIDYNNDGRPDFWKGKQYDTSTTSGEILTMGYDGAFASEQIALMTPQEYYDYAIQTPSGCDLSLMSSMSMIKDSKPVTGANGCSYEQIDINNDGYIDFIDYPSGYNLLNTRDGRYVIDTFGGMVAIRDFDGDGINDIFFYDSAQKEISVILQNKEGGSLKKELLNGFSAATPIWIRDFDKDGDLDILIPFNPKNNAGQAYLVMFINDGNGNFKRRENFIDGDVVFRECVDYDADGNYEVIATCSRYESGHYEHSVISYPLNGVNVSTEGEIITEFTSFTSSDISLMAANIDNSGLMRLVCPDRMITPSEKENVRPNSPSAPNVAYNSATGEVSISWNRAADKETAQLDLTYELRIGSAPDKGDILHAYATADGVRQNMAQGNCGYSTQRRLNASTWPDGKIYVSVQAIDGGMMGSRFSEYTIFEKRQPAASFVVSAKGQTTVNDEIELILDMPMVHGASYDWSVGDGIVESHADGRWTVVFPTPGEKELTLTVTSPSGSRGVTSRSVNIIQSRMERATDIYNVPGTGNTNFVYAAFDMDLDGRTELFTSDRNFLEGDESGNYSPIKRLFNSNLSWVGEWMPRVVADVNNDGLPDMVGEHSFLVNDGDKYMTKEYVGWRGDFDHLRYDIDNDGYLDLVYDITDNSELRWINRNTGDYKTFANVYICESGINLMNDFNGDGLVDFICDDGSLYINKGDFNFQKDETFDVPEIIYCHSILAEDIDGNGKVDIAWNSAFSRAGFSEYADTTYIRWDNGAITKIPALRSNDPFHYIMDVFDFDNNGCRDLVIGSKTSGYYVVYMYPDRTWDVQKVNGYLYDVLPYKRTDGKIGISDNILYGATNEAPTAPIDLRASQNKESVVIAWNYGADKETPAAGLKYNISIKRKGKDEENAYFMSPLNDGMNGVAVPAGKMLFATPKITIPIRSIPAGNYEVKVQSVDMQGVQSDFSETLELTVAASGAFDLPASTMIGTTTRVMLYAGINATEVDFGNDAEIVSFTSQYVDVCWHAEGIKTVKCGDFSSSIYVHPALDAGFVAPDEIFAGTKVVIKCDNTHNSKWELVRLQEGVGGKKEEVLEPREDAYSIRMVDGNSIELIVPENSRLVKNGGYCIRHTLTEDYGTDVYELQAKYSLLSEQPAVSVVDIDNDGYYRVNWNVSPELRTLVTDIKVFRETSKYGVFELIATLDANTTSYSDVASIPIVKSERYAISYGLTYGETLMSPAHQPMHLMVNRGAGTGWNLSWNKYEGRNVISYRILRGDSPSSLKNIAEVAGSISSYTDVDAPAGECFYAVEFDVEKAGRILKASAASYATASRSNVVSTSDAGTLIPATYVSISSIDGSFDVDGKEKTELQLIATVYPVDATMRGVNWMVSSGEDIVSINASGLVKVHANGYATVRAVSTDGSSVYAEVDINVKDFTDITGFVDIKSDEIRSNNVYNAQGLIIKCDATDDDLRRLAPGLYIFRGRKIVVK